MPANKSHKGTLKRIRITRTGKVRHKTAGTGHLKSRKSPKRLRQMRRDNYVSASDAKRLSDLLHTRLRGRDQPRSAIKRSPSPEQRRQAKAQARSDADNKD